MADAASISRALKGTKTGDGFLVRCPVPTHGKGKGDRHPSLSLRDGDDGRLLVCCHAECDPRDVLDVLRGRGLIEGNAGPPRQMTEAERNAHRERALREDQDEEQRIAGRQARAREIFAGTIDPRGSLAEKYLERDRGLPNAFDDVLARTVRFHPACPFKNSEGKLYRAPAMIAAFRDIRETLHDAVNHHEGFAEVDARILGDIRRIVAIHRTQLDADGHKIGRAMLGPTRGAGIFLCSPIEICWNGAIAIGEGIETCLSAKRRGFSWTVALGSSGAIARLEPIRELVEIHLFKEADEASERAVVACGERWHAAGVNVFVAKPHADDFNSLDRRAA